jgi:hypothetical protein
LTAIVLALLCCSAAASADRSLDAAWTNLFPIRQPASETIVGIQIHGNTATPDED